MHPIRLPLLILILFLALPTVIAIGDDAPTEEKPKPKSFDDYEASVKTALESEEASDRAQAFQVLHDCGDLRCVELILSGVKLVKKDQVRIRREQVEIEESYEKAFSKKVKADIVLEASSRSSKDLDKYNKKVRKIRKKLNTLNLKLKSLENHFTRTRAQLDGAVQAMGKVLSNLGPTDFGRGLQALKMRWRNAKEPDAKLRWLDAIAELDRPIVAEQIREAVEDQELPVQLRASALQSLGARKDPKAFELALKHMEPGAEWDMTVAGIWVLRLIHDRKSVEPLITFLKRDDLKRLREDVHKALKSLTGKRHGPYFDPWHRWWEDRKDVFQMPDKPQFAGDEPDPAEGVTFYGIHTFSNRILFVLDVSGSMDKAPKSRGGAGPKPPNIQTARKELIGAIENLDEDARFNLIFFNHEVIPWQPKMQDATNTIRRRVKEWILAKPAEGGTNIHDAFEIGFGLAERDEKGEPVFDTIYFLTDGRPTGGKLQDSARILEQIEEWNRAARVTIHCVGLGDHDEDFMRSLAKMTGGRYVKR